MKRCGTEQLLGLDKFVVDDEEAHIEIEKERCRACSSKPCCVACPPGFMPSRTGRSSSTMRGAWSAAPAGWYVPIPPITIRWRYPRGGFGIQYRYG